MSDSESTSDVKGLLDKGLVQLSDGKIQDAVVTWMKVLDLDPNEPRALDYLETLEVIEPRSKQAIQEALEGSPELLESGEWASPFSSQQNLEIVQGGEGGEISGGPLSDEERTTLIAKIEEEKAGNNLGAALELCEEILKRSPDDTEAEDLARDIKAELVEFYLKDLKPLEQVPQLLADDSNILELSLDPIGGFLLSQIDGNITIEELLTIMGTFEQYQVVSALHQFLTNDIIELKG